MIAEKRRVIVADDDPAVLDVMRLILEDDGYVVETHLDGETLHTFPSGYPDLLLLDIWMPGWDGGAFCRALKSSAATRHLPVVLCSANRDVERIAREMGADGFIAKPFDIDTMLRMVALHVGSGAVPVA